MAFSFPFDMDLVFKIPQPDRSSQYPFDFLMTPDPFLGSGFDSIGFGRSFCESLDRKSVV